MADDTISGETSIEIPKQSKTSGATLLPSFEGCSYLNLETYKIDSQKSSQKGSTGIDATKQAYTFKFLLPENFQENIQHTWSDYTGIMSAIAQRVIPAVQTAGGGISIVGNTLKNGVGNNAQAATGIFQTSESAVTMRFDAALTYQTSARRRYMFELHFADCGDPYKDVVYPIKLLEWLSSAATEAGFAQITRPYIFRVYTTPVKFLYLRYAALESILPNYSGPYRNGYPTSASVQLSFVELDPLYKEQIKNEITGGVSSTSTSTNKYEETIVAK